MKRMSRLLLSCLILAGALVEAQDLPRTHSRYPRSLLQTGASGPSAAPSTIDVTDLTATDAIALLCSRNITSVAYVQALFDHFDNGGFECHNSFITLNREQVIEEATAIDDRAAAGESITPLCGLPLAVKDSIDVEGYPTTGATPSLFGHFPSYSAPIINAYKQANGIIMGKANMAELSWSISSINPNSPNNNLTTPLNPYNQTKIPGGSSGGSATAVADRTAPWSLCEDTGGSCRSPAIANGIFGLRPTLGCYNTSDGLLQATFTRDTVGPLGRTMGDLILLDSIMRSSNITTTGVGAFPDPVACAARVDTNISLSGLRLGLPSTFGWVTPGLSSQMANLTNMALDRLTAAGVELVPFDSSNLDEAASNSWGGGPESLDYELPESLARYLFRHNYTDLSVNAVYEAINKPPLREDNLRLSEYREFDRAGSSENWVSYLSEGRPSVVKAWRDTFQTQNVQAFLYPGSPLTVQALDAFEPAVQFDNGTVAQSGTSFYTIDSISVATALAFPIGLDNTGTPAGLQISAPPGDDGLMLSLGLAMERIFGPMPPPPTTAACSGCTVDVSYVPADFNFTEAGTTPPGANDTWTEFVVTFNGTCASDYLTGYGNNGPLGRGLSLVDESGIESNYVNATMFSSGSVATAG